MAHVSKKKHRFEAQFSAHYDKPVSKVEKVKTHAGTFTVGVFKVGKDWRGKPEYEYELAYPDGGVGMNTRKFESTKEAVDDAVRSIARHVQDEEKKAAEARKSPGQKRLEKLSKEIAFFKEHGGGIVGHAAEGALHLARAEKTAQDLGWTFDWTEDDMPWDGEGEPPAGGVYSVLLRDENGEVIGSLGGVGLSGNRNTDHNYTRVVEAEVALEAATEKKLL